MVLFIRVLYNCTALSVKVSDIIRMLEKSAENSSFHSYSWRDSQHRGLGRWCMGLVPLACGLPAEAWSAWGTIMVCDKPEFLAKHTGQHFTCRFDDGIVMGTKACLSLPANCFAHPQALSLIAFPSSLLGRSSKSFLLSAVSVRRGL